MTTSRVSANDRVAFAPFSDRVQASRPVANRVQAVRPVADRVEVRGAQDRVVAVGPESRRVNVAA